MMTVALIKLNKILNFSYKNNENSGVHMGIRWNLVKKKQISDDQYLYNYFIHIPTNGMMNTVGRSIITGDDDIGNVAKMLASEYGRYLNQNR